MAGFSNDVMYADNVRFDGGKQPGQVNADGQLLIGATASPNIRVATLTAGAGISITNGAGSITIGTTGPTGLTWTDVAVPTLAAPFMGYFVTAATTVTLPAGAAQGDLVAIAADTAGAVVIQANVGQSIQVAATTSAVAGSATSTALGCSLWFYFRAATSTWISTSVVGNWNVV